MGHIKTHFFHLLIMIKRTYTTSLTFKLTETEEIVGILPLYTQDPQISPLFHYYAKNCLHIGLTFATLKVQARSIRLLYDFYYHQDSLTGPRRKTFLEAFATHLNKRENYPSTTLRVHCVVAERSRVVAERSRS